MNEGRMSIPDIIGNWLALCGEEKTGHSGGTYLVVPIPNQRGHFLNLIQDLITCGYSKEEIKSGHVRALIAKTCWSDLITKLSTKNIKRNRDISTDIWDRAIAEFFAKPVGPAYTPPQKTQPLKNTPPPKIQIAKKSQKEFKIEPPLHEKLGLDVSDVIDAPFDTDFLKKLGIDETFFDPGKKK